MDDVERPQLIAVSMDEDVDVTLDEARGLATQYIGQQPHIIKALGISEENADPVKEELDRPASGEDIESASKHAPDDMVKNIVATGTRKDIIERLDGYCEAGCSEPVVYPLTDNMEDIIDAIAEAKSVE